MIRLFLILALATSAVAQVPVLLDTDMNSDCDDAGALGLLHALADRGEARILGVASCTHHRFSAGAIGAINTYYGRSEIPIAQIKGRLGFKTNPPVYLEQLATEFPTAIKTSDEAEEPVSMYRRILAAQPDGSVTFIAIGWLINLRDLLRSGPDEHSRLSGVELVARKVKVLVDMGPRVIPPGKGWNFQSDPLSAVEVIRDWPTPIVFSGKEICWAMTGSRMETDAPQNSPVRRAYELWKKRHNRAANHSADQTAVLYAVRGAGPYWHEVRGGHLSVREDGWSEWKSSPQKDHTFLAVKMSFQDLAVIIDRFMMQRPADAGRQSSSDVYAVDETRPR